MLEITNIAMRQAADALSRLLGRQVRIETPRLRPLESGEGAAPGEAGEALAVQLKVSGTWGGSIVVLFAEQDAREILSLLLQTDADAARPLSELEVSALLEIGNIMASACLNAAAVMLKTPLLPSVPNLVTGAVSTIIAEADVSDTGGTATVVEAEFSVAEASWRGRLILIPGPAGAQ